MTMPTLEINIRCISCDNCRLICPENAILTNGKTYSIDTWSCTLCGLCTEVCPTDAIDLIGLPEAKVMTKA